MSSNTHDDHIKNQRTITPGDVYLCIPLILATIWSTLFFLVEIERLWSSIITLISFGAMIQSGVMAVDVPSWYAAEVFNHLTKRRRVMFGGFHFKLPWESLTQDSPSTEVFENLKREIASDTVENFTTNDPAERMDVGILIHVRRDVSGTPQAAADKFIRSRSIDESALLHLIHAVIVKLFQEYYGGKEMEELLKTNEVLRKILSLDDYTSQITRLQDRYGVHIGVEIRKNNPDEATRKLKAAPARAEALRTAKAVLMRDDPEGRPGYTSDMAARAALIIDESSDYREERNVIDVNLEIDSRGLENLQTLNVVPTPGTLTGNKSKKGGGK